MPYDLKLGSPLSFSLLGFFIIEIVIYEIINIAMKEIKITRRGLIFKTQIDDKHLNEVNKYSWRVNNKNYVFHNYKVYGKKHYKKIYLHHFIWFLEYREIISKDNNTELDHIDINPLTNQLNNLRKATRRIQMLNRKSYGTSKYKGVSWDKSKKKWSAQITINKKTTKLSRFNNEIEAHEAYKQAFIKHYGYEPTT